MDGLDFITDTKLRKKIEDSIEFAYALYEDAKKAKSVLFQEETYRVIILYTVSVIEAILLYLYKKHSDNMTFLDYKFIQTLPPEYQHTSNGDAKVILAVQTEDSKKDFQIGMSDLIVFFKERNILKKKVAEDLAEMNELRNTFHLSKSRDAITCDVSRVESAFKLLVDVIKLGSQT